MPKTANDIRIVVVGDQSLDLRQYTSSFKDIENLVPSGVVLRYGLNAIPTALLELTPDDLDLTCNIEHWRRAPVRVEVHSVHGCITFRGLIDGISVSQSVGDMRMQLVLKHPMQLLNEINPKLLGYHPAGVDFTRRVEALKMEVQNSAILTLRYAIGNEIQINLGAPLFDGILGVLKAMVRSQLQWKLTQARTGPSAEAAVKAAEAIRETHLKIAETLLNSIDTSFVKTNLSLSDFFTLNYVLETICETRSNIFDVLLTLLETVGCGLVIGNRKAFIVPNSGFLQQPHKAEINFREVSKTPNVFYPSQYNNVSFNDNGYRDISGVYLMSDDRNVLDVDGFFQDTKSGGTGGVIGEVMPYVISFNNAALRAAGISEVSAGLSDSSRPNSASTPTTTATAENAQHQEVQAVADREQQATNEQLKKKNEVEQRNRDAMFKFADDWAQLRYYQLKYTDRMGGIGLLFNPNCAPGAVGSVYLRAPGVYIDFFVTDIVHEIRMGVPDSAQATTHVGFNCGRMGAYKTAPLSSGLEKLNLFDGFDAERSAKVAAAFVKDIQ